jgi:hypothetical protein
MEQLSEMNYPLVSKGTPLEPFTNSVVMTLKLQSSKVKRFKLTSGDKTFLNHLEIGVEFKKLLSQVGKVNHKGHMIIELGNIQAKWMLLIEGTCMLSVNRKVTVWIRILLGVRRHVTNKGEIYYIEGTCVAKLVMTVDRGHKGILDVTSLETSRWPNLYGSLS